MPNPGRPTTYTLELSAAICERVLTRSLRSVCLDEDMPAEGTVYGWLAKHPEFFEEYARARAIRAFRRETDMDEITEKVADQRLEPDQARVMIDAIKWQTGRENARVFGTKVDLNHAGSLSLEQLVAGTAAAAAETTGEPDA
jgi:hypothetical protein